MMVDGECCPEDVRPLWPSKTQDRSPQESGGDQDALLQAPGRAGDGALV